MIGRPYGCHIDPLANRTSFGYDAASRPVSTTNALGFVSSTIFDAADRPVAAIDALGNRGTTYLTRTVAPWRRSTRLAIL